MLGTTSQLSDRELMRKGTSSTLVIVFDRHARDLRQRLLAEIHDTETPAEPATGLAEIRADLVDAVTARIQQRPQRWMRYASAAAMLASVLLGHTAGWPVGGG
jgi:hypothetical protein